MTLVDLDFEEELKETSFPDLLEGAEAAPFVSPRKKSRKKKKKKTKKGQEGDPQSPKATDQHPSLSEHVAS